MPELSQPVPCVFPLIDVKKYDFLTMQLGPKHAVGSMQRAKSFEAT